MLSKGTYQFVMSKIQSANNGELMAIKDQLRELLRHPISVDAELMRDTKKLLKKIDAELDARYDLYLSDQRQRQRQQAKHTPASASGARIYPFRNLS